MPMAYINRSGSVARLRGESLLIEHGDKVIASWELIHIDAVMCVGRVAISSPALAALARHRIPVGFIGRHGKFVGSLSPAMKGSIDARIGQHDVFRDRQLRLRASRRIIRSKIESLRHIAETWFRSAPEIMDRDHLDRLTRLAADATHADSIPSLMGMEGAATASHFGVLRRANRSRLRFSGRSTRPPRDEINAALSFGYTVLCQEIRATLEVLGLDPHIGVLHECVPNRPALALDIVEPFRGLVVDRCVVKAANLNQLKAADFTSDPDDGFRLQDDARGRFLALLERRLGSDCPGWLTSSPNGPQRTIREAIHARCIEIARWYRSASGAATHVAEEDELPFELHVPGDGNSTTDGQAA